MKKILIIKIGAIGDVILSLPLLSLIREKHKNVAITWVCGKLSAPLLKATKLIDHVIEIDEKKLFRKNPFLPFLEIFHIWRKIGGKKFDQVLMPHKDFRYKLLWTFTKSPKKVAFSTIDRNQFIGKTILELFDPIWKSEKEEEEKSSFPPLFLPTSIWKRFSFLNKEKPIVTLSIGGRHNFFTINTPRAYPIESYLEVAKALLEKGYSILLTGEAQDSYISDYFQKNLKSEFKSSLIDMIGKTSLLDLYHLFVRSALVITHDSGPLHLARAANVKLLALFGPTSPLHFMGDIEEDEIKILWEGKKLTCSPCYMGKGFPNCKENLCMQKISPKKVVEEALFLLNKD